MNPHDVFCPNPDCPARGRSGEGGVASVWWTVGDLYPRNLSESVPMSNIMLAARG